MLYLWIHLAGIALVPVLLQVLWLSLAISQPLPFFWLELVFLIIFGLVPIILMQWNKPFAPFNFLIFCLKIESLTEDNRRILTPLKSKFQRFLTAFLAVVSLVMLWTIYQYAPLAREAVSFFPQVRILGLLIAVVVFLITNLFLQVSLSVIPLLLLNKEKFNALEPYAIDKIKQDFFFFGFPVGQFLSLE